MHRLSNAQKRESAKSLTPSAMSARDDVINVNAPLRAEKAGGDKGADRETKLESFQSDGQRERETA